MAPRTLLCITAVVLAAHAAVLLGWPAAAPSMVAAPEVLSLQTRTLAPPPPPPPPPPKPAPKAPAAPAPRPRPPPPPPPPPEPPAPEPQAAASVLPELAQLPQEWEPTPSQAQTPAEPMSEPPDAAASSEPLPESADTAALPEPAPELPPAPAPGIQITLPGGQSQAAPALQPQALPAPTRLLFAVTGQAKGFAYSAQAELLWQHDGEHYQAHQELSIFLLGKRSQTSSGRLSANGLQPERFTDKGRRTQSAQLDFDKGLADFSGDMPAAPIGPGSQDRISVFLQLSWMLATAPQDYPEGSVIEVTTVGARRVQAWRFQVAATQALDLPQGTLQATRLDRLPSPGDDQRASIWLAPELQYLPVRIRLEQGQGDFADLQLKDHETP